MPPRRGVAKQQEESVKILRRYAPQDDNKQIFVICVFGASDLSGALCINMKAAFRKNEKIIFYILSFLLPVLFWLIVCALHGIYPFGDTSVMTGDITYQFIDYLAYFKSIFTTNNDLTYTFSKTMGGDMAGFFSYYLLSPFNFILLLFPNRLLPLGLLIIIMVKCGFMSLFFSLMLNRIFGFKWRSLIFGLTYALSGYVVVYFQLYAYFDDLMLMPLIFLGLRRMFKDPEKKYLYIAALTVAIILNFYVGWMICLFCLYYFVYLCVVNDDRALLGKRVFSFVSSSVLCGVLSAFVVIPSVLSLRGEKNSFHLGFYRTMELRDFFSRFYIDSFKGNISSCMPNVYCGTLMLLLFIIYFFNKKIPFKERIASLVLTVFLLLNFYINTLNVIWHGFNRPIGFPYRYSFVLIFLILYLGYRGLLDLDVYSLPKLLPAGVWAVYILYSAYLMIAGSVVVGLREVILNALILFVITVLFILYVKRKPALMFLASVFFLIQLFDIGENLNHSLYFFEFSSMGEYQTFVDRVGAEIDNIKAQDDGFFRVEKTFRRSHNDTMQFDYAGLSHYSSCEKKDVISYMNRLGFRDNGNWSFYDGGSTALVDSVFGIKYLISHYDYMGKKYKRFNKTKYPKGEHEDKYFVYRNQYALPLMFVAKGDICSVDPYEGNLFEFQNALADSISGGENNMFEAADIEEKNLVNLAETPGADGVYTYTKLDPSKEAYLEFKFGIDKESDGKLLEGYFDAPDYQKATIEVNGDSKGEYFSEYHWSVVDMAKHDEGENISVKVIPEDDTMQLTGVYIYFEDMVRLKNWVSEVSSKECELKKITSSHLLGSAWLPEDGQLVFSFPYEDDWKVYIDGEKVETQRAAGLLLSAPVNKGVHQVELYYEQAGRRLGLLISLAGVLMLICLHPAGLRKILSQPE